MFPYGLISVSVASLRKHPSHVSEQVSQLLFGEKITILSQPKGAWIEVRNDWDNYEGWILKTQFCKINDALHKKNLLFYSAGAGDLLLSPNQQGIIRLSPGSDLFLLKRKEIRWPSSHPLTFKGKRLNKNKAVFSEEHLQEWVNIFLGTPYLWGGRSIFGIDCSGLSQIIFKLMGYRLSRDASQQAKEGNSIHFLQDAHCGDLAFFDNAEGKINHVGILLNNHTIAHASEASGKVVIDAIDSEGIISAQHKIRTHKLRLINRYF